MNQFQRLFLIKHPNEIKISSIDIEALAQKVYPFLPQITAIINDTNTNAATIQDLKPYIGNLFEHEDTKFNDIQINYILCLLMAQQPNDMLKYITPMMYSLKNTPNIFPSTILFEECPMILQMLCFAENFITITQKDPIFEEKYSVDIPNCYEPFIQQFYQDFLKYYRETFHKKQQYKGKERLPKLTKQLSLYQIACLKIITYALIWNIHILKRSKEKLSIDNEKFKNLNSGFIIKEITNTILETDPFYAKETGIDCLLMLLRNNYPITLVKHCIRVLTKASSTESVLGKLFRCISYIIREFENKEYKTLLQIFLVNLDYTNYSSKLLSDYLYMMTCFITTGKFNLFPIYRWFRLCFDILVDAFNFQLDIDQNVVTHKENEIRFLYILMNAILYDTNDQQNTNSVLDNEDEDVSNVSRFQNVIYCPDMYPDYDAGLSNLNKLFTDYKCEHTLEYLRIFIEFIERKDIPQEEVEEVEEVEEEEEVKEDDDKKMETEGGKDIDMNERKHKV